LPIAVSLGASLYERHVMLPDDKDAIDGPVSSTPDELAAAIRAGRRSWAALGSGTKTCLAAEAVNVTASRRSLCAARPLPAGHLLRSDDLVALRPATGVSPADIDLVLHRRLMSPLAAGEPLTLTRLAAECLPEHPRVA
jgi:sialic acid synthase SpsE